MDSRDFILGIHQSKHKAVLAITGGGAGAISELLRYGQGSNTVLEAIVPYDPKSFDAFVKGCPDKYCSPGAARDLAMAAFQRAIKLNGLENAGRLIGVGASSSLAKDNERAGREHHAYVSIQTFDCTRTFHYDLTGSGLNRVDEEERVSQLILAALGYVTVPAQDNISFPFNLVNTSLNQEFDNGSPALFSVLTGKLSVHNVRFVHASQHPFIFAGSFNPFHDRHGEIAAKVHELTGSPVDLEVCVHNVDKPALNYTSLRERRVGLENLADRPWLGNIHFTALPTFVQKAQHFPGATFVVGWDTFKRISDPKYAGNIAEVVQQFMAQDVKFLVFHRITDGKSSVDENLDGIFQPMLALAQIIPPNVLPPVDMSSSEIRKKH